MHAYCATNVVSVPPALSVRRIPRVLYPIDLTPLRVRVMDRPSRAIELVTDHHVWIPIPGNVAKVHTYRHLDLADHQMPGPVRILVPIDLTERKSIADEIRLGVGIDVRRFQPIAVTELVGDKLWRKFRRAEHFSGHSKKLVSFGCNCARCVWIGHVGLTSLLSS